MVSRIAAATVFVLFVAFVNLAAAITASMKGAHASLIGPIAGVFQVMVDLGALVVVALVLVRALVKFAHVAPRPIRVLTQEVRYTPVQTATPVSWTPSAPQPLPFDNNAPAEYIYVSQAQPVTPAPSQGVLADNIHRMRQQRDGYRMVR